LGVGRCWAASSGIVCAPLRLGIAFDEMVLGERFPGAAGAGSGGTNGSRPMAALTAAGKSGASSVPRRWAGALSTGGIGGGGGSAGGLAPLAAPS
jgi:hypothetical protein